MKRFFVDNTRYLPSLLSSSHSIFLRPPRFGKSLLLSTMEAYFDVNNHKPIKEGSSDIREGCSSNRTHLTKFDQLFEGLAVQSIKPHTKFHVLKWVGLVLCATLSGYCVGASVVFLFFHSSVVMRVLCRICRWKLLPPTSFANR